MKGNILKRTIFVWVVLLCSGCTFIYGTEVVRFEVDRVSSIKEKHVIEKEVYLEKGVEYTVWTDIDMAYVGKDTFFYAIDFIDNNQLVDSEEFLLREKTIQLNYKQRVIGSSATEKYSGKLGKIIPKNTANYLVRVMLLQQVPTRVEIKNADVYFTKK